MESVQNESVGDFFAKIKKGINNILNAKEIKKELQAKIQLRINEINSEYGNKYPDFWSKFHTLSWELYDNSYPSTFEEIERVLSLVLRDIEDPRSEWIKKFEKSPNTFTKRIIRIANDLEEKPMWESDFGKFPTPIPTSAKGREIKPADHKWAKEALESALKKMETNKNLSLTDWLEHLPSSM